MTAVWSWFHNQFLNNGKCLGTQGIQGTQICIMLLLPNTGWPLDLTRWILCYWVVKNWTSVNIFNYFFLIVYEGVFLIVYEGVWYSGRNLKINSPVKFLCNLIYKIEFSQGFLFLISKNKCYCQLFVRGLFFFYLIRKHITKNVTLGAMILLQNISISVKVFSVICFWYLEDTKFSEEQKSEI